MIGFNFFQQYFRKYNFTVDENSSINAEIAIDPEMSRIENLLVNKRRKQVKVPEPATGFFYTPREIVDYMVEQSITEYLKTIFNENNDEPILESTFGVIPNQLKLQKLLIKNEARTNIALRFVYITYIHIHNLSIFCLMN